MSFDAVQIRFLQRLIQDRPAERKASAAADFFCKHYQIGVPAGSRYIYCQKDFARAAYLLQSHDLPVAALPANAQRADAAFYGGMSEKTFGMRPHAKSVAIKIIGRCTLDGETLVTPVHTYLVVYPSLALAIQCDCLLLIENFETFRCLENYRWLNRTIQGRACLVLFRGDNIFSPEEVMHVLRNRKEPVWAFTDFDPSGLMIAATLPRFKRLLLPDEVWLTQAANSNHGRRLFADQEANCGAYLEGVDHPEIKTRWHLMRRIRSAVVQEKMQHYQA